MNVTFDGKARIRIGEEQMLKTCTELAYSTECDAQTQGTSYSRLRLFTGSVPYRDGTRSVEYLPVRIGTGKREGTGLQFQDPIDTQAVFTTTKLTLLEVPYKRSFLGQCTYKDRLFLSPDNSITVLRTQDAQRRACSFIYRLRSSLCL